MRKINQDAKGVFDTLTEGMNEIGDHVKIENGAFMPLCIELIGEVEINNSLQALEISFCHYGEQNGDLMRDPEMNFLRINGEYYPSYFRNDYLGVEEFSLTYDDNGKPEGVKPKMQRNQAIFTGQWALNLREQGFIKALQAMREAEKDFDPETKSSTEELLTKEVSSPGEIIGPEDLQGLKDAGLIYENPEGGLTCQIPACEPTEITEANICEGCNESCHECQEALKEELKEACEVCQVSSPSKEFDDYPTDWAFAR